MGITLHNPGKTLEEFINKKLNISSINPKYEKIGNIFWFVNIFFFSKIRETNARTEPNPISQTLESGE